MINAETQSLWTKRNIEIEAPERRIIHQKTFRPTGRIRLKRLGLTVTTGYHRCGCLEAHEKLDPIRAVRVFVRTKNQWQMHHEETDIVAAKYQEGTHWISLPEIVCDAVAIEARRCQIDNWWTGWDIVNNGVEIDCEPLEEKPCPPVHVLSDRISGDPSSHCGVNYQFSPDEVRVKTRYYKIGFSKTYVGLTYLSFDSEGKGHTSQNLLSCDIEAPMLGLHLHPVGGHLQAGTRKAWIFRAFAQNFTGSIRIDDGALIYEAAFDELPLQYVLKWTFEEKGFRCLVEREASVPLEVWSSAAIGLSFNAKVTQTAVLGKLDETGRTGLVDFPLLVNSPGHGTLKVTKDMGTAQWRSDCYYTQYTSAEIKLAETPTERGTYLLEPGHQKFELCFHLHSHDVPLRAETPEIIRHAIARESLTALTFRPDTATLSNNANSMHCVLSMAGWSHTAPVLGEVLPGLHAMDFVKLSVERWLDDGPSYACGPLPGGRRAEDAYIDTTPSAFIAMAGLIHFYQDKEWVEKRWLRIEALLKMMQAQDLDHDGLIESALRHGISGEYQWSSNWWDVISFGWKDGFANALLYRGLVALQSALREIGMAGRAERLSGWIASIKKNYFPALYNPKTGWLGGWVSKDGKLHDWAFLFVNGSAINAGLVAPEEAKKIMRLLWEEWKTHPASHGRYGLPGNLWKIPTEDLGAGLHHTPYGFYENGGRTLSQSHHFVDALYAVGMEQEGDSLLHDMCTSIARGTAFGGAKSGVDWRFENGISSGYEGLLSEQFAVIGSAIRRFRAPVVQPSFTS